MSAYLSFLWRHRRFLAFGALAAASASFGQTWFVALFGAEIRASFGLGHGGFGIVYSAATLASGLSLIWVGRLIDRLSLGAYTLAAYAALAAGCIAIATAGGVVGLGLALFTLRLAGQGMLSHVSATSMARHFERGRGKALSIAATGFPAAETVLPAVAVLAIAALGWRGTWVTAAAVLLVGLAPAAWWLLRGPEVPEAPRDPAAATARYRMPEQRDWTRHQVLRDPRFRLILPALLAAPFISTGFMFHQVHLVEAKGWNLAWLAVCYVGYAGAKVGGNLLAGPLVDRFTAVRLFPAILPPLGLGLLLLATGYHRLAGLGFFALAGLTTGVAGPIAGAYWAERYGLGQLGAIRALAMSVMVLGSALSPAVFGLVIDGGGTMEAIAWASAAYVGVAVALAAWASTSNPDGG